LWIALCANAAMFLVELAAAWWSGSSALAADAADFLGDSANYALSLGALALGGAWISRVALLKGTAMALYGVGVLVYAAWRTWLGIPPEPVTMGVVGLLALCVNFGVAMLLFRFREGDANMRSVWLCTRNDVIASRSRPSWPFSGCPPAARSSPRRARSCRRSTRVGLRAWKPVRPLEPNPRRATASTAWSGRARLATSGRSFRSWSPISAC
jgi:hypothetical protein